MKPRTLYGKLIDSHTVVMLDEQNVLLFCDLHLMNEYTSPQAFAGLNDEGRDVLMPGQNVAVVSHIIPTHPVQHRVIHDPASALQASNLKVNCLRHHIPLFDTNDALQGIEHIIAPEHGMIRPGMVVMCGDSHTTTYGALGALGFGIGTSEVEHVLATQTLVYRLAQDMRIRVDGQLPIGTTAKDLILMIISRISAQGARGFVVEFCGSAIDYVLARALDIDDGMRDRALSLWATLRSDEGAVFDVEHVFDASHVAPYVTWGTSPDQAVPITGTVPKAQGAQRANIEQALRYTGLSAGTPLEGLAVDHVFIGSCTNARIEDLRAVATIVKGRHVASTVRAMVVPGSGAVKVQAEAEGISKILIDAGFEWRQPGCSMCLAMNDDVLEPGQRCASTTNRNFEGRQGRGAITHLMSPAMAAAAAVTGHITDVRGLGVSND